MTNDRYDSTVINGIICMHVKEGRLKYSRRKHDLVHVGLVIGVDGRRRHTPIRAIDRLADLVKVARRFELCRAHRIQNKRPAIDGQQ